MENGQGITPVFNKGVKLDLSNYCPILVIPAGSKGFEKKNCLR